MSTMTRASTGRVRDGLAIALVGFATGLAAVAADASPAAGASRFGDPLGSVSGTT